ANQDQSHIFQKKQFIVDDKDRARRIGAVRRHRLVYFHEQSFYTTVRLILTRTWPPPPFGAAPKAISRSLHLAGLRRGLLQDLVVEALEGQRVRGSVMELDF